MKLKITKPGYHDQDGKPVEVGTIVTIKGDGIPASLLNKCEVIGDESAGKEPATGQKPAGKE